MNQQWLLDPLVNTIHESTVWARRNHVMLSIVLSPRIPPEGLWCIFLYKVTTNDDQQRRQGELMPQHRQQKPAAAKPNEDQQRMAKRTNTILLSTIYWVILIPFPSIMCSLKCLLQQNIMCPFSRLLPEKHHVFFLSKILSHKTVSRKTSYDNWVSKETRNFHFTGFSLMFLSFSNCTFCIFFLAQLAPFHYRFI